MQERSLTNTGAEYRFDFYGQIADHEIAGDGNSYSAAFWQYSSRLGRRWNMDPEVYSDKSSFSTFSNCPTILIDPNGNTDFYSMSGDWIGTDGVPNSINTVVTEEEVLKKIKKTCKKGKIYTATLPNQTFFSLPSQDVNQATLDVFDAGGEHEAATQFNCNMEQSPIAVGEDYFGRQDLTPDVTEGPAIPEGFDQGAVSIHSHPYNVIETADGLYSSDANEPSPEPNDRTVFENYDLNIIVGKYGVAQYVNTEDISIVGNQVISRTISTIGERPDVATYWNNQSQQLYSIEIDSLRIITDGSGKTNSSTYTKYAKKNEDNETN